MSSEIQIAEFARGNDKLVVRLREYEGARFIDLRIFVNENGQSVPTRRGVTVRLTEADQLVAAIDRAQIIAKGATP